MLSRSKAQLSPRRSHVCVVSDCIDSVYEKIAMIYVVSAKLDSIKERWVGSKSRKEQYAFVFNLTWSDGSLSVIWRSYNDVFDFQCGLLDSFPEEAGTVRGFVRIIPYLPGIFAYLIFIGISVTNTPESHVSARKSNWQTGSTRQIRAEKRSNRFASQGNVYSTVSSSERGWGCNCR